MKRDLEILVGVGGERSERDEKSGKRRGQRGERATRMQARGKGRSRRGREGSQLHRPKGNRSPLPRTSGRRGATCGESGGGEETGIKKKKGSEAQKKREGKSGKRGAQQKEGSKDILRQGKKKRPRR